MILRFLSFTLFLVTARSEIDDRQFVRRSTVSEGDINIEKRVILHCKQERNQQECLNKLKEFNHDEVKIIHKFKSVEGIAVSISKNDQIVLKTIDDSGLFDIFSDPIRKPMYIKESVRVEDGRKLQFWGQSVPYGIEMVKAQEAWEQFGIRGEGVKVCVMDTGLYAGHDDFVPSNLSGYSGREAVTPWDSDGNGHGTHVSGTIAAADNNKGVVGVAPDADIYTVRGKLLF
jgi:subtilisin family serine protease